jgi:hypothetical protein
VVKWGGDERCLNNIKKLSEHQVRDSPPRDLYEEFDVSHPVDAETMGEASRFYGTMVSTLGEARSSSIRMMPKPIFH